MNRSDYYRNETDKIIINTLLNEIYYKNLINLNKETNKRRDFKRDKKD